MIDFDADIDVMIDGFDKEELVFEGNPIQVLPLIDEGSILTDEGARMHGRSVAVQARTSLLSGIKKGSAVTFRGASWAVREPERSDDGRTITLYLMEQ